MVQKWHLQRYGVSSGAASPRRSIHQNCKVRLNHVLRKKRFLAFGRAVLFALVGVFASFASKKHQLKRTMYPICVSPKLKTQNSKLKT